MKQIATAIFILAVLLGFCYFSAGRVEDICEDVSEKLRNAETACRLGQYQQALDTVREAEALWNKHKTFLGLTLRHTESDEVDIHFPSLSESLMRKDADTFLDNNLEVQATINQIADMEQPWLCNIL